MKDRLSIGISFVSLSLLVFAGCDGSKPSQAVPVGTATFIYVAQNSPTLMPQALPQVLQFPANAVGNPSPANTITFATVATISAIATDASGNIYVASDIDLREYAAGSSGTATPIRLIPADATTTLGQVTGITVDASGNIYAAELNASQDTAGVAVFSSTANGSVAPARYILGGGQPGGGLSTLQAPSALATDSSGNLYVVNQASSSVAIDVFAPTATGNVAPIRTIEGSLVGYIHSIAIDSADNLYASNDLNLGSIYVYAKGTTGNATPTRSITQIGALDGLTVDLADNIYIVINGSLINEVVPATPSIATYPSGSTTAKPASTFTAQVWQGRPMLLAVN